MYETSDACSLLANHPSSPVYTGVMFGFHITSSLMIITPETLNALFFSASNLWWTPTLTNNAFPMFPWLWWRKQCFMSVGYCTNVHVVIQQQIWYRFWVNKDIFLEAMCLMGIYLTKWYKCHEHCLRSNVH